MTNDNPQPAPSAYRYVMQTGGLPMYVPVELGGTGNWQDYQPGHPPVPVTEAAKAAERMRSET